MPSGEAQDQLGGQEFNLFPTLSAGESSRQIPRAQASNTAPPPLGCGWQVQVVTCALDGSAPNGGLYCTRNPLVGLRGTSRSRDDGLMTKGCDSGTAGWKNLTGHSAWGGYLGAPVPSSCASLPKPPRAGHRGAVCIPPFWVRVEALLQRRHGLKHGPWGGWLPSLALLPEVRGLPAPWSPGRSSWPGASILGAVQKPLISITKGILPALII